MNDTKIPATYDRLLENLKRLEGGVIHHNRGEIDITTGYGVYRGEQPYANVFDYIVEVSQSLGITKHSRMWTPNEIDRVNAAIDPEIDKYNHYIFYRNYFKRVELDIAHPLVFDTIVSLYTNGQKLYTLSLQKALNDLVRIHKLDIVYPTLKEDGLMGEKTLTNFRIVSQLGTEINRELKYLLLLHAKTYYITLATMSPTKYGQYLRGWNNRVDDLICSR